MSAGRDIRAQVPARARPGLMILVYGIFLVLVGVTASALVMVTSSHLSSATLSATVSHDGAMVEMTLNDMLLPADLVAGEPVVSAHRHRVEAELARLADEADFLRIELRSPDGATLLGAGVDSWAASPLIGEAAWRTVLEGRGSVALVAGSGSDGDPSRVEGPPVENPETVIEELLPLRTDAGEVVAVVAVWRHAAAVLERLDAARRDIMLVTLAASLVLAALLFAVFRAAQVRISSQHAMLIESERRDGLTGLLNHGAIVGVVAELLEAARSSTAPVTVALIDVDNFRLLNEAHGHAAGDVILLRVAELVEGVRGAVGDTRQVARYGPDEFLLVCRDATVPDVVQIVADLRRDLAAVAVQFGESEQLPVTVSAGVCSFPEHATSVTELLSGTVVAVSEARASGGDLVRVFGADGEDRTPSRGFDVLHGLVIAVDTKDRYTKRHSEDVARYAAFLAQRMGLDEETVRTLRLAGLLHDVGKIGIPDDLLRKPSKLTSDEYAIFQQHVVLGDAIVRDLPHVENVRAGIRYHHERWDGRGYVEGLDREEIPLAGRILAVADAFSAMTTTRPYRKALSLEEALKRLGDAAGTQLQEELVTAFISGIETAADAPLPGEESAGMWRPARWAA